MVSAGIGIVEEVAGISARATQGMADDGGPLCGLR